MVSLAPGDPISLMMSNENVNVENVEKLKERLHWDLPWIQRYAMYMSDLLQGDLGWSIQLNRPISDLIKEKIGNTLLLAGMSCAFALLIAIPLGVAAAANRRSVVDYAATAFALSGVSVPSFYLGLLLILLFGLKLGWLPIRGLPTYDATVLKVLRHMLLPSVALGSILAGILTRLTRSSMLETMGLDFVRTARAKGLSRGRVLYRHVLRNALLPVVTTLGMQFGALLGGSVIIETIFSLPGLGFLAVNAVKSRDIPLIQGTVLVFAMCFVVVTLFVDIIYVAIDPRIRYD
jgi:peptide/nickel transport system permease protein